MTLYRGILRDAAARCSNNITMPVFPSGYVCIKKVWEVDPLTCHKCTGEMKIISFIYKRTVIKKLLDHLGVYKESKNQRAPPLPTTEYTGRVEIVPGDDDWPGYEEAVFEC